MSDERRTFVLHHGGAERAFSDHPTEVARRALITAAEVEDAEWRPLILRAASALPYRAPLARAERA